MTQSDSYFLLYVHNSFKANLEPYTKANKNMLLSTDYFLVFSFSLNILTFFLSYMYNMAKGCAPVLLGVSNESSFSNENIRFTFRILWWISRLQLRWKSWYVLIPVYICIYTHILFISLFFIFFSFLLKILNYWIPGIIGKLLIPRIRSFFFFSSSLGPSHWPIDYQSCVGKHQSPINIEEHNVKNINLPPLRFEKLDVPRSSFITNNGHTGEIFFFFLNLFKVIGHM